MQFFATHFGGTMPWGAKPCFSASESGYMTPYLYLPSKYKLVLSPHQTSNSAGNFPKSGKQTFWVMSPHKVQLLTLTTGVRFFSVVKKKKVNHAQKSKIRLQKFRGTWKHFIRGIGGGEYLGSPQKSGFGENLISNILR
jgi:hypothetical protein